MKCKQSCPGFELVSSCPFPATINISPRHIYSYLEITENFMKSNLSLMNRIRLYGQILTFCIVLNGSTLSCHHTLF